MKYDRDVTTDSQIIETLDSLPGEITAKFSLREYCRATRQVFIWCLPSLTKLEKDVIEERLQEKISSKMHLSTIVRMNGILPEYKR